MGPMEGEIPPEALAANALAGQCIDERRFVDAIAPSETAVRLCPDWPAAWANLTVGYKHAHRWEDVLRACDRMSALAGEPSPGPHWNAGIAATALRRWDRARAEWAAAGIALPPGEGPLAMALGLTPIRVAVESAPEVVWCDRIDPCRARIVNVPLPESQRRHGDLVLHDGEPRGKRRLRERSVSVFDELEVLEESPFGTWEVVVSCANPGARDALVEELSNAALVVEDWTASFQIMCEACSLGDPDARHDHGTEEGPWSVERRLGVAARAASDLRPLRRARLWWRREVVSVRQVI
jgi:hypothetical protein